MDKALPTDTHINAKYTKKILTTKQNIHKKRTNVGVFDHALDHLIAAAVLFTQTDVFLNFHHRVLTLDGFILGEGRQLCGAGAFQFEKHFALSVCKMWWFVQKIYEAQRMMSKEHQQQNDEIEKKNAKKSFSSHTAKTLDKRR